MLLFNIANPNIFGANISPFLLNTLFVSFKPHELFITMFCLRREGDNSVTGVMNDLFVDCLSYT